MTHEKQRDVTGRQSRPRKLTPSFSVRWYPLDSSHGMITADGLKASIYTLQFVLYSRYSSPLRTDYSAEQLLLMAKKLVTWDQQSLTGVNSTLEASHET